ncbi:hypothetical protein Tco_0313542 [Tanacetum coccineum]
MRSRFRRLRHDQECKKMKLLQDMQLIQKLHDDQKRMKKVFEDMSGSYEQKSNQDRDHRCLRLCGGGLILYQAYGNLYAMTDEYRSGQSQYTLEILKKHGMDGCDTISTLMATAKIDADLQGTPADQTKYVA